MPQIGPSLNRGLTQASFWNSPQQSKFKKRPKFSRQVVCRLTGKFEFHDLIPYLERGKQHGKVRINGHWSYFIKQGHYWNQLVA